MGAPDMNVMERGETYAETILEGKLLPSQELLRMGFAAVSVEGARRELAPDLPELPLALVGQMERELEDHRQAIERAITQDMEVLRSWLAMAWYCGYQAAQEARHSRMHGGRR